MNTRCLSSSSGVQPDGRRLARSQEEEADLVLNMRETLDDMTREGAVSDEKRGQLAEIFMMSSRLEGLFSRLS